MSKSGRVKKWFEDKNYGFINQNDASTDIRCIVHAHTQIGCLQRYGKHLKRRFSPWPLIGLLSHMSAEGKMWLSQRCSMERIHPFQFHSIPFTCSIGHLSAQLYQGFSIADE